MDNFYERISERSIIKTTSAEQVKVEETKRVRLYSFGINTVKIGGIYSGT